MSCDHYECKMVSNVTAGWPCLRVTAPPASAPETSETGNWQEDFAHENGDYECQCVDCGRFFRGHKRRVVCKPCASKPAPSPATAGELTRELSRETFDNLVLDLPFRDSNMLNLHDIALRESRDAMQRDSAMMAKANLYLSDTLDAERAEKERLERRVEEFGETLKEEIVEHLSDTRALRDLLEHSVSRKRRGEACLRR